MEVKNAGSVAGDDVVQLYVSCLGSKVERAPRELKAFARVHLDPGETQTVDFTVPAAELAWYDEKSGWVVEATEYMAIVARNAHDDDPLAARFRIGGS